MWKAPEVRILNLAAGPTQRLYGSLLFSFLIYCYWFVLFWIILLSFESSRRNQVCYISFKRGHFTRFAPHYEWQRAGWDRVFLCSPSGLEFTVLLQPPRGDPWLHSTLNGLCLHSHSVPLIPSCPVCVLLPWENIEPLHRRHSLHRHTSWSSASLQFWHDSELVGHTESPSRIGSWHLSSKCSVWFSLIYNSDFFLPECSCLPVR